MITPDDNNLDLDNEVNDPENPQDSISNQQGADSGEPTTAGSGGADNEGIDRAAQAAEASFTLEAQKGISPEPDQDTDNPDDYNIKQ